MRPVIIIELEVLGQSCFQFNDTAIVLDIHILIVDRSPQALHKDVIQGPSPPIMAYGDTFCLQPPGKLQSGKLHTLVTVEDPGFAKLKGLFQGLPRQKFPSSVLDNRQDSTDLLYQSMMATRYINPWGIGIEVISVLQTWWGWIMARSRSQYG
jgi:hypothetical protein